MQLLEARGDVPEALNVYDCLRQRLRDDLGIYPAQATQTLFERMLAR